MTTGLEKASWNEEPTAEFVVDFLRRYFRERNAATQADKIPVPMFGQMLDKPNIRREYGGEVIDGLAELDSLLGKKPKTISGQQIFEKIAEFRTGPEGLIPRDFRETIHNLAEDKADHPLLRLGNLALEGTRVDWRQEHGIISEAMVAIELHAIAQSNETAA